MIKIVGNNVLDLLAYKDDILFVMQEASVDGQQKISYYSFDIQTQSIASVTKNAYLMTKFGPGYAAITACLEDCIACSSVRIPDGRVFVVYQGGETGVFQDNGTLLHTNRLVYQKQTVRSLTFDGKNLWFVVPDANVIVRYNPDKYKIDLRIGDNHPTTFEHPISLSHHNEKLYVCCKNTYSVKQIDLQNFAVGTCLTFNEPILKYLRTNNGEVVVMNSGIYLL